MAVLVLVLGVALGVGNIISSNHILDNICEKGGKRFNIKLGYFMAGYMFSWALFEGLFPLIGQQVRK